jgi:hypothetical protein
MAELHEDPVLLIDYHQAHYESCIGQALTLETHLRNNPGTDSAYLNAYFLYESLAKFHLAQVSKLRKLEQQLKERKLRVSNAGSNNRIC